MARKKLGSSMSDIVAEVLANPRLTAAEPMVPGQRNALDEISTPAGEKLENLFDEITPETARLEVEAGALVVWGACGCGPTDCGELEWPDPGLLRGTAPKLARKEPSWLSLWAAGRTRVVFAHGAISWGRSMA